MIKNYLAHILLIVITVLAASFLLWSVFAQKTTKQTTLNAPIHENSLAADTFIPEDVRQFESEKDLSQDQLSTVSSASSEIERWNTVALDVISSTSTSPPEASRFLAILHIAIYEALNSIEKSFQPYHGYLPTQTNFVYNEDVVISSAAKAVIDTYYPQYQILTTKLQGIVDENNNQSALLGTSSASQIMLLRQSDGYNKEKSYTIKDEIGQWNATPPYYETPLLPQWGDLDLFVATSKSVFPDSPPEIDSPQYAIEYQQVLSLGGVNSTTRTQDQSEIAKFWADGKGTYTPPGHWNSITQKALRSKEGLTIEEEARCYALLNIAMADAAIQTWKAKFAYEYWRPIDAIRMADNDGNQSTIASPQWFNYVETPNFPEYPSGHSAFSGAASAILATMLGDDVTFTTTSLGMPDVSRSYSSFSAAAKEAGMSRIYRGIHFQKANTEGLRVGREIAKQVFDQALAKK